MILTAHVGIETVALSVSWVSCVAVACPRKIAATKTPGKEKRMLGTIENAKGSLRLEAVLGKSDSHTSSLQLIFKLALDMNPDDATPAKQSVRAYHLIRRINYVE